MSTEIDVHENVSDKAQATDPRFNMEPAMIEVPGTPYAREMAKWNKPYRHQEYPKMLYKAERFRGTLTCQPGEPQPWEYKDERAFKMAIDEVRHFIGKCQLIVKSESEKSRAMETGWREHPDEALAYANKREDQFSQEVAHRNYDDRNLSDAAKAEIREAEAAAGGPVAEITEKRRASLAAARAAKAAKKASGTEPAA